MAQDPLSRVASWLTPASADVTDKPPPTSVAVDDPVLALIAEEKRLEALWIAADAKGQDNPQAKVLDEAMGAILNQLRNRITKPVTLAGAIAMLELGLEGGCIDDGLINAAIASLRDMQREASREAGETAGEPLPIDTAPIKPGEEFPCLLWAQPWQGAANKPPFWHRGRWDGEDWCDDHAGIIFPTYWHPLPKPGPIAERRSWHEQYQQLLAKPDAIGFGEPEDGGAA